MFNPDIFAYVATSLNLVMFIPQVVRTWKTKRTRDLSLTTLTIFFLACLLWVIYGLAKAAAPVVLANVVVGAANLILIILKIKYPEKVL